MPNYADRPHTYTDRPPSPPPPEIVAHAQQVFDRAGAPHNFDPALEARLVSSIAHALAYAAKSAAVAQVPDIQSFLAIRDRHAAAPAGPYRSVPVTSAVGLFNIVSDQPQAPCDFTGVVSMMRPGPVHDLILHSHTDIGQLLAWVDALWLEKVDDITLASPWKRLGSETHGGVLVSLKAAANFDGICVLAHWHRDTPAAPWIVDVYDEESNTRQTLTDFGEGEPVPPEPPILESR